MPHNMRRLKAGSSPEGLPHNLQPTANAIVRSGSCHRFDCYNGHSMMYRVYLQQDEDDIWVATCPSLPGCVSQGVTRSEAQANIREAIALYLKSLRKHGEPVPPGIEEEVVEVTG